MLAGHLSTALVAHQKFPKGTCTLLYFLIASQLQQFFKSAPYHSLKNTYHSF